MSSSAQIISSHITKLTENERVKEFLEIIHPLEYETIVESGNAIYIKLKGNDEKSVHIWINQEDYPIFKINKKYYYREAFFDFIWDDKRYGNESMNSDMILAITAEYMKKYPDALFNYEWSNEDTKFMDKTDIDMIMSQPFQPSWFYLLKSHRISSKVIENSDDWMLT